MRLDKHVYHLEKIIVGGCLSSCLYSFINKIPLLTTSVNKPFLFDEIDVTGTVFESEGVTKIPEVELWEKIIFYLSLRGLIFGTDLCRSARLDGLGRLKITTEFSRLAVIEFEKMLMFQPEQVSGLPEPLSIIQNKHQVIDWFTHRQGSKHKYNHFYYGKDFLNEVWFYSSPRAPDPSLRDSVVRSYLTQQQIQDFDYSSTMARILMEERLSKALERKVILEHAGRDIRWEKDYVFEKNSRIEYINESPRVLLSQCEKTNIKVRYDPLLSFSRNSPYSL